MQEEFTNMNIQITADQIDENGLVQVNEKHAADMVGAGIKFHFPSGDLECKVLCAYVGTVGNNCPLDAGTPCEGCTCLVTDKGEVLICKGRESFLKMRGDAHE